MPGMGGQYHRNIQFTEEAIDKLKNGLTLSNQGSTYKTKPCEAKKISPPDLPARRKNIRGDHHGPTSWVSITLTEGKYRQVRKMTAARSEERRVGKECRTRWGKHD